MKKLLSLTLAAAMVMSMASVAFAATKTAKLIIGSKAYTEDSNVVGDLLGDKVGYGDSVVYPIYSITTVTDDVAVKDFDKTYANWTNYEMAKKLKVKATWESAPELVKGVSIAKKKQRLLAHLHIS